MDVYINTDKEAKKVTTVTIKKENDIFIYTGIEAVKLAAIIRQKPAVFARWFEYLKK